MSDAERRQQEELVQRRSSSRMQSLESFNQAFKNIASNRDDVMKEMDLLQARLQQLRTERVRLDSELRAASQKHLNGHTVQLTSGLSRCVSNSATSLKASAINFPPLNHFSTEPLRTASLPKLPPFIKGSDSDDRFKATSMAGSDSSLLAVVRRNPSSTRMSLMATQAQKALSGEINDNVDVVNLSPRPLARKAHRSIKEVSSQLFEISEDASMPSTPTSEAAAIPSTLQAAAAQGKMPEKLDLFGPSPLIASSHSDDSLRTKRASKSKSKSAAKDPRGKSIDRSPVQRNAPQTAFNNSKVAPTQRIEISVAAGPAPEAEAEASATPSKSKAKTNFFRACFGLGKAE